MSHRGEPCMADPGTRHMAIATQQAWQTPPLALLTNKAGVKVPRRSGLWNAPPTLDLPPKQARPEEPRSLGSMVEEVAEEGEEEEEEGEEGEGEEEEGVMSGRLHQPPLLGTQTSEPGESTMTPLM
ncbi:unnamed protein product [Lota lota]